MTIRKPQSEISPLSGWDEFPIHQTPQPLRVFYTADPRAYERYWFAIEDPDGRFVLMMGMGFYPNQGTADAYAAFNADSVLTTVRAHRLLGEDRHDLQVGPIGFDVVAPFEQWHLTVGPNEFGLEVDIDVYDTKRSAFSERIAPPKHGRISFNSSGYENFTRIEGTISLGGKTYTLDRARHIGSRDHHWGYRDGVGGYDRLVIPERSTQFGQWVEFDEFGIWGDHVLYQKGSAAPQRQPVVHTTRRLSFDPETHHFTGGVVRNLLADGEVKEVSYELIDDKVIYLRTGLYSGPGPEYLGDPETNLHHGEYAGELVTGASYDLSDPGTRVRIAGFEDQLVRATCDGETAVGLIECRNPVLWEWCEAGRPGYAFL